MYAECHQEVKREPFQIRRGTTALPASAPAFFSLDLFPVFEDFRGIFGAFFPEYMRMTANHFLGISRTTSAAVKRPCSVAICA